MFESQEQERPREKRDSGSVSMNNRGPVSTDGRVTNIVTGNFSDPNGVSVDQYAQYQQQPMIPPTSSQMSHTNAGYIYPSPTSATSPSDASQGMPNAYPSTYHSPDPVPSVPNGMSTSYGYVSPHDPSPVVPSQSHSVSTYSDADYSRIMLRNIGVIGFDFYPMNTPQYSQTRTQPGWINNSMGDSGFAGPSYANGDYSAGYQQQRGYDGYQR